MAIINAQRPAQNLFIASRLARIKSPSLRPLQAIYKRKPEPKIKLPNVTIWAASWGTDARMLERTLRVICYCRHNIQAERIIHFSRTPAPFPDCPWETIIIPELDMRSWNVFVNRVVPNYIQSGFAMSVHEDGFPLDFSLWKDEFLKWDYIGAPWLDGTVGNGGFNIESQKMLKAKLNLPVIAEELVEASDTHICVKRRKELEAKGIRFAPKALAQEFSVELTGHGGKSFGFHGRQFAAGKYREGWEKIEASEKEIKIVLLYLRVLKCSDPKFPIPKDYDTSAKRFLQTYNRFKPPIPHELVIVNCGSETHDGLFDEVATRYETDFTGGFDCGSWQHVGGRQDCDLVVGLNTHCYLWRDSWLEPFVKAFSKFGPGVYGPTASYEQNPHLRTPCIAFSPEIMKQYPYPCDTRLDAGSVEFGPNNFSLWAHRKGYPVRLVTENNSYDMSNWRKASNGFRSGSQSNCLVLDRHTEIYASAKPPERNMLERAANGKL